MSYIDDEEIKIDVSGDDLEEDDVEPEEDFLDIIDDEIIDEEDDLLSEEFKVKDDTEA